MRIRTQPLCLRLHIILQLNAYSVVPSLGSMLICDVPWSHLLNFPVGIGYNADCLCMWNMDLPTSISLWARVGVVLEICVFLVLGYLAQRIIFL